MTDESFDRLATRYFEGVIDGEELRQLNHELAQSPDRVKRFNDLRLLAGLIHEHGEDVCKVEHRREVPIFSVVRSWPKEWVAAVIGIFTGCLGTGMLWAFNLSQSIPREIPLALVDGSFESDPTDAPGYPLGPSVWTGDSAESVASGSQGIEAFEGDKMLRFLRTSGEEPGPKHRRSNRWQVVSLPELPDSEQAFVATVRARFNRVGGDAMTDTEVRLEIAALKGSTSSAEQQISEDEFLSRAIVRADTDNDLSTWETFEARIVVSAETDFLLIGVAAVENVLNDPPDQAEFDGHYVDAVELTLAPISPYQEP